jgi:hypothetical protein
MVRRIALVLLIVSLLITGLNVHSVDAYASASGYEDIEPDEWWYYPMIVNTGERLSCFFYTDRSAVEYFIVNEVDYVEYSTISENKLIYYGISASASFSLIAPEDGGWFWVFINIGPNSTRVHYEWETDLPPSVFTPYNLGLVSLGLVGIVVVAVIIHVRRRGQSSA